MQKAIAQYRTLQISSRVESADPTELIQMLFEGAHARIAEARGSLQRDELVAMRSELARAVGIVEGLQASLDLQSGGELAANLHRLYSYVMRRLWQCSLTPQAEALDEVAQLLGSVSSAWSTLGSEVSHEASLEPAQG